MLLTAGGVLRADWKADLLAYLGPPADYHGAREFLGSRYESLEPEDRQTAGALLPYLSRKTGDLADEEGLVAAYFETYRDNDPDLSFLDDLTRRDFLAFWYGWKSRYPLVHDIALLHYGRAPATGLPAAVEIGLELMNDAFYRLSLGPFILDGGYWRRGFHILAIPVRDLFDRSETVEFFLDLKAGDLIVRKPIRIGIDIARMAIAAPAPEPQPAPLPLPGTPTITPLEGELSLYVDGRLILRSRKIAAKPPPLSFPLPGPSMPGQKPYMPPPKNDPMASGVSIIDALALAYKAIKDLTARKPPKPSLPAYSKVDTLAFSFMRTTAESLPVSARATVSLLPSQGRILRE